MRHTASMKWQSTVLIQLIFIVITQQSITGVTYRDHFNFEERYSNVLECDPFYWHPLHLPEHCAEMYASMIRSGVVSSFNPPADHNLERQRKIVDSVDYNYDNNESVPAYSQPEFKINRGIPQFLSPETPTFPREVVYGTKFMSPYEKMLELLRRDVRRNPTAPVVGIVPNLGPVALYEQPISRKSEKIIKKLAQAYVDAGQQNKDEDEYYYGMIDIKPRNTRILSNNVNENGKTVDPKKVKLNSPIMSKLGKVGKSKSKKKREH